MYIFTLILYNDKPDEYTLIIQNSTTSIITTNFDYSEYNEVILYCSSEACIYIPVYLIPEVCYHTSNGYRLQTRYRDNTDRAFTSTVYFDYQGQKGVVGIVSALSGIAAKLYAR